LIKKQIEKNKLKKTKDEKKQERAGVDINGEHEEICGKVFDTDVPSLHQYSGYYRNRNFDRFDLPRYFMDS
jgi:hypothetical protein